MRCKNLLVGAAIFGALTVCSIPVSAQDWPTRPVRIVALASHVIAPVTNPNPGFDPIKSFAHIAYIGGPPVVAIVHPSLGVRSLKDFIAAAKGSKDARDYVSPGPGTLGNLVAEYWARKENVKLEHIPYKEARSGGDRDGENVAGSLHQVRRDRNRPVGSDRQAGGQAVARCCGRSIAALC
jgi:tripartite-type tricarboxylate transporter receptor subunit TctC